MTDLNNVTLIGRLVANPEVRYSATGTPVLRVSIAVNESIKKNNDWQNYANFFDIVAFGNIASNCEKYLKKGSQIAINGSLRQSRWTDKNTNQKHSKVEIMATSIQFLGKSENDSNSNTVNTNTNVNGNIPAYTPITDPWSQTDILQGENFFSNDNNDGIPF